MEEPGADTLRYTGHCAECKLVINDQPRFEVLAKAGVLEPTRHSGCDHIIAYRLTGKMQGERI
jgi:hypothetical protein